MRRSAPTGTVAFLFTDIEGSTELWQNHGQAMTDAVAKLDVLVDRVVGHQDGFLAQDRGEGDGHFIVFDQATKAVITAADLLVTIESERWPSGISLRMRAGLHLGEVDQSDSGFYGSSVNQAARLRSLAHGGQAVASRIVADATAGRLPSDLHMESLGHHRVRNWPSPTEIYQVCRPDLQREFSPLHSQDLDVPAMVAVVVLDVAGSASFARQADHNELVAKHRTTMKQLRQLFDDFEGRVFHPLGDGCLAGFVTPSAAIRFARQARADLITADQPTRIGVDFGSVEVLGGELAGHTVYVAYELCSHAEPNTIIVSSIVQQLIDRHEIPTTSVGALELRSTTRSIEAYRL